MNIKKLFKDSLIIKIESHNKIDTLYNTTEKDEKTGDQLSIIFKDSDLNHYICLSNFYDGDYSHRYLSKDDKKIYAFLYVLNKRTIKEISKRL
jgi:hypothetical protein